MGKMVQNYHLTKLLSENEYVKIYFAQHVIKKEEFVIKVVSSKLQKKLTLEETINSNSDNVLINYQSSHIVKYIEMLKTVNNFYFVYEYCSGETLQQLIKREGHFSQQKSLIYFWQILDAFKMLVVYKIMHRSIEPNNIFIQNQTVKISDIGFEEHFPIMQLVSPQEAKWKKYMRYKAPQVQSEQKFNMKSDIWSIGLILYEMLFGFLPFEKYPISQKQQLIIPKIPTISPALERLLRHMLVIDHQNRIDWKEIFQYKITENGEIDVPVKKQLIFNQFVALVPQNDEIEVNTWTKKNQSLLNEVHNEEILHNKSFYALQKSYNKCKILSQLIKQTLRSEKKTNFYIAYFLLEGIEKELKTLIDRIQIQFMVSKQEYYKGLQSEVFEQLQYSKEKLTYVELTIQKDGEFAMKQLQNKKQEIIGRYLEQGGNRDEEGIILNLQVIDFLEDGLLLEKQVHRHFSLDHLIRRLNFRLRRYIIIKDL